MFFFSSESTVGIPVVFYFHILFFFPAVYESVIVCSNQMFPGTRESRFVHLHLDLVSDLFLLIWKLTHTHFTAVFVQYTSTVSGLSNMLQTRPESRCWLVLQACWCCRKWPPRSSLLNCETRLSRVCWYFCYMVRDERGVKFAANPQRPVIWIRCDSSFKSGMVLCANGALSVSPSLSRCVILQTVLWCDVWTSNYF